MLSIFLQRIGDDQNIAEKLCFETSVQVAWLCRCEKPGFGMTISWHVVGHCMG